MVADIGEFYHMLAVPSLLFFSFSTEQAMSSYMEQRSADGDWQNVNWELSQKVRASDSFRGNNTNQKPETEECIWSLSLLVGVTQFMD